MSDPAREYDREQPPQDGQDAKEAKFDFWMSFKGKSFNLQRGHSKTSQIHLTLPGNLRQAVDGLELHH